jgi:hypothetical protein
MKKFVFVYNADTGGLHAIIDVLHKIVSPSTYPCHLCTITYDTFGMRRQWQEFISQLPVQPAFLYKNELTSQYPLITEELPAVFIEENGVFTLCVPAAELNTFTLHQLIDKLRAMLLLT